MRYTIPSENRMNPVVRAKIEDAVNAALTELKDQIDDMSAQDIVAYIEKNKSAVTYKHMVKGLAWMFAQRIK